MSISHKKIMDLSSPKKVVPISNSRDASASKNESWKIFGGRGEWLELRRVDSIKAWRGAGGGINQVASFQLISTSGESRSRRWSSRWSRSRTRSRFSDRRRSKSSSFQLISTSSGRREALGIPSPQAPAQQSSKAGLEGNGVKQREYHSLHIETDHPWWVHIYKGLLIWLNLHLGRH